MPETVHDLLSEGIFSVEAPGTARWKASLPQVFAALAAGQPLEFCALEPYQLHAWHAFLVQLAALAWWSSGAGDQAPVDSARWTHLLRRLTAESETAWCLVVPDLSQPAFMQPPVPEGSIRQWPNGTRWPDEIDVLETAKNHDVKSRRVSAAAPEHWVYAMVSLQTMQGYSGKNNYGVARMNGGYGSRPGIAAARDPAWPTRFSRDVHLLLSRRPERYSSSATIAKQAWRCCGWSLGTGPTPLRSSNSTPSSSRSAAASALSTTAVQSSRVGQRPAIRGLQQTNSRAILAIHGFRSACGMPPRSPRRICTTKLFSRLSSAAISSPVRRARSGPKTALRRCS